MTAGLDRKETLVDRIVQTDRAWIVVALLLVFASLYTASLLRWLSPLTDERMVGQLGPVVFLLIGYLLGVSPARQNERTMKSEIDLLMQAANSAQQRKEDMRCSKAAVDERLKNVRTMLESLSRGSRVNNSSGLLDRNGGPITDQTLRGLLDNVIVILAESTG